MKKNLNNQAQNEIFATIAEIRERIEDKPARSAWEKGVKLYAHELLDRYTEAVEYAGETLEL